MKRVAALLLVVTLLGASPPSRAIDPAQSRAQFSISHIWVEHVMGTIPIVEGSVSLAPGSLVPTAATATFDPAKVSTGEPDRDRSLASPDFFDAQKYPRWTFTSTSVVAKGSDAFEMDGDITIHGVTRPIRLDATVRGTAAHPEYRASGQIDRHQFGMAVTRLDPTIGTTVDLTIDVTLK
ncbi:MAG TPA: YceI family protein [Candidatus Baltobacteraceae bacterium]|jgi:polyisoprenoid-binding protein YceI|nr:YceI family protein [Candidatus Baltobacteraceae bacterium]